MAKVSQVYASPWLHAEDLQNRTIKVVIARAGADLLPQNDGTRQNRIIVEFVNKSKKLICNRTQASSLAAIAGDDTAGWTGVEVFLSPTLASNGKGTITVLAVPTDADHAGGTGF